MKLVEHAIYELLKSLADEKVYAARAPDNAKGPFIVFQRVDSERWRAINGPSGYAQCTIQVDAYADEYYAAKELGAEIEEIMDGYAGTVQYGDDSPQKFVEIAGVSLQNEFDTFDQTEEPYLFRSLGNYIVTFKQ